MPAVIKFYTDEYTEHNDQFATYDAIANIVSALTEEGFAYKINYWIVSSSYDSGGRQILAFEFKDERKAMLLKLKGIKNG
jgi:hypothetical protein